MTRGHGKISRQENARRREEALIEAALRSIGNRGYSKSSVSRITEEAGVSQGTLYSYFGSHRSLLEQLLPIEGRRLLDALGEHASNADNYFDAEHERFTRLLGYLTERPYILRLIVEAEVAAPESFLRYMKEIERRYAGVFKRAIAAGQVRPFRPAEMQVIAEVLAGCRTQLALHQHFRSEAASELRFKFEQLGLSAYDKFIRHGVGGGGVDIPRRRKLRPPAPPTQRKIRAALFEAAGEEILRVGFEGTSVRAITAGAGVAIGTFYAHFPSRQDFLLHLLTYCRRLATRYVSVACEGSATFAEAEARGFRAWFDLLREKPWLNRVSAEGAVWAPDAYRRHFGIICRSYERVMRTAKHRGELQQYTVDELAALGAIFTAARHYLASRYARDAETLTPNWVFKTYITLLTAGLSAD